MKIHNALVEKIGNIATILAAGLICASAIRGMAFPSTPPSQPVRQPSSFEVGEKLPDLVGVSYSRAAKTVMLHLSPDCPACVTSMPAYVRLVDHKPADISVVAITRGNPLELRAYLDSQGLRVDSVASIASDNWTRLRGLPSTLIANREGVVAFAAIGGVDQEREIEIGKVFATPDRN